MTGWETVLEVVLIGLLAALLYYIVRLERAFRVIDKDRVEFDSSLRDFLHSSYDAETKLVKLHEISEAMAQKLTKTLTIIGDAEQDLNDALQRGNTLASRLENVMKTAIDTERSRSQAMNSDRLTSEIEPRAVRSKAERDLLRVLRAPR